MSDFNTTVSSALWNDLDDSQSFPAVRPLLAHYTSVATLEKIILNSEVWFSNPLFMNDVEELRFGMRSGASEFRSHVGLRDACGSAELHARLLELFEYQFSIFDAEHALDTYVLCLSEHKADNDDGVLSMWRGYGADGGGVAIVIDSSKIEPVETSPFLIRRVVYLKYEERTKWFHNRLSILAQHLASAEKTDENLNATAYFWIERLAIFSLFTKHDGFFEENEWRVVYLSQRDLDRGLVGMQGYNLSSKGVEPKLKLKLEAFSGVDSAPLSLEKIVERIILGPSISTALARGSLCRMLELAGSDALVTRVVGSSIPYRPGGYDPRIH